MNSNFPKLHDHLLNCSNFFKLISVTETWSADKEVKNKISFYQTFILYIKTKKLAKKGGILIYLKNDKNIQNNKRPFCF